MKQEEIFFKGEAPKTKIKYFTNYSGQTSDDDSVYYVVTDLNHMSFKLVQSIVDTEFALDYENNYVPLASGYQIYTGSVIHTEVLNSNYSQEEKNAITSIYVTQIQDQAIQSSDPNISHIFSTVFFEESKYNDYFLNVKLNRSIDPLDTLNVYNVPYNDSAKFTNDTGVLYGKIEAIQVLIDDTGNKIRIPIKNATIGIFNPSDEIPSVGSVDQNGNRIRLNLFENIQTNNIIQSYGSFQSFLTDVKYSPKDYENDTIPPKYKYTTITNDYGEFVLHGIPVGQQTLMVEIDLLKQGLEPEEVALNFFPYSTLDDPNVSNIPHLYFNQFPINIVPSWGEIQTGYTEIDLAVVLDLRKWITYFTYPITSKIGNSQSISNKIENSIPLTLEEQRIKGISNPFTVYIRDMTKPFDANVLPKIELVKIIDIFDKNLDFKCAWNEEFKVKGNKVDFFTSNYNAFKLPANLYDPDGINTNGTRGVWLGAYQLKASFPSPDISYQVTGYEEEWPVSTDGTSKYYKASHFDLNRYLDWSREDTQPLPGAGIGKWPYQKPWTLTYPEPYIVTKRPSVPNPLKQFNPDNTPILNVNIQNRNGVVNNYQLTPGQFFIEPRFLDGDLVGGSDAYGTNANGYGLQTYSQVWAGNDFSREVTKNEIWRYEGTQNWADEWSNGYMPGLTSYDLDKYPNSRDGRPETYGERWQRIEAGFAYWLRPRGWPRTKIESWGDHLLENDYIADYNHDYDSVFQSPVHYNSYYYSIYSYLNEVTLQMGAKANFFSQFGGLSIYRIEKPYYCNQKKPPFTEKYAKFHFQSMMVDQSSVNDVCRSCISDHCDQFIWLERGGFKPDPDGDFIKYCNTQFVPLEQNCCAHNARTTTSISIRNIGTTKVSLDNGSGILLTCDVNQEVLISNISSNSILTLPANDKYDAKNNCFNAASYTIEINNVGTGRDTSAGGSFVNPIYRYAVGPEGNEVDYYLSSLIPREVGIGPNKCAAVRDYNTNNTSFFGNLLGALSLLGGGGAIFYAFNIFQARDNIDAYIRNLFDEPEKAGADWRRDYNNGNTPLGLFINGLALCAEYQIISPNYLLRRGTLPYIGEETKEARELDWVNNLPYYGNSWYQKMKSSLNSYPYKTMSVFQPKTMHENNLKGKNNTPYFMEFPLDGNTIYAYKDAF